LEKQEFTVNHFNLDTHTDTVCNYLQKGYESESIGRKPQLQNLHNWIF